MSEEIKSHLINISDNYSLMKTWLISNNRGPSRIVGDIINNLSRKSKPVGGGGERKEKFGSTPPSQEQSRDWKDYPE